MHSHGNSRCPYIRNLELENSLSCIVRADGVLLWASPLWFQPGSGWQEAAGLRWTEWVFPDDVAAVLAWLADGRESTHTYRAVLPVGGRAMTIRQHKLAVECFRCRAAAECVDADGHWLIIAAAVETIPTPDLPAAPCLVGDLAMEIDPPARWK